MQGNHTNMTEFVGGPAALAWLVSLGKGAVIEAGVPAQTSLISESRHTLNQ